MLKYSLCLLGAYILYYAAMIVYDLFLKKEKAPQVEPVEEFTLPDFAKGLNLKISTVGIEDVENLRTPKSFQKTGPNLSEENAAEERPSLDEMRRRFESEEDLDAPFGETAENPEEEQPAEGQEQEQAPEQEPVSQQSEQPAVEEPVEIVHEEPAAEMSKKNTELVLMLLYINCSRIIFCRKAELPVILKK